MSRSFNSYLAQASLLIFVIVLCLLFSAFWTDVIGVVSLFGLASLTMNQLSQY